MAEFSPGRIHLMAGDLPSITLRGSVPHVSFDGEQIGQEATADSLDVLERWFDQGAHDIAMLRAQLRLDLGDDASDAVCEGRSVA